MEFVFLFLKWFVKIFFILLAADILVITIIEIIKNKCQHKEDKKDKTLNDE